MIPTPIHCTPLPLHPPVMNTQPVRLPFIRGSHLSDTTCVTHAFFRDCEECRVASRRPMLCYNTL